MASVDKPATLTLADFLLARIAEDEEELKTARIGDGPEWWMPDFWNRSRGLAECEAKRKIVALHVEGELWCHCGVWYPTVHGDEGYEICPTLKFLAIPYAGHPDFREEWRKS